MTISPVLSVPRDVDSSLRRGMVPGFQPLSSYLTLNKIPKNSSHYTLKSIASQHLRHQFARKHCPSILLSFRVCPKSISYTLRMSSIATQATGTISLVSTTGIWGVGALIIATALCGLIAEKTPVGAALSASLVTMCLSLILCNFGILPTQSPIYTMINKYVVVMAVPLLLFEADLRKVLGETGRMLWAFCIAAFGTIVGTLVAWILVPMRKTLGNDGWKIASALTARHIGGAVNYVATTKQLQASDSVVMTGVAADNVIVAVFFLALFALATRVQYKAKGSTVGSKAVTESSPSVVEDIEPRSSGHSPGNIVVALLISGVLCVVGTWVSNVVPNPFGSIPVITCLVVTIATCFPQVLQRYRAAARFIGILFMQIFFAATGASGSIATVIRTAPMLFLFSAVQLVSHLIISLLLGRVLLRIPMEELLLASNAAVGGPSTSAGMASSKRWNDLIVPAILVGVFGYTIATFVSITMGQCLLRHWR